MPESKRLSYARVWAKRAPGGGVLWIDGRIYYMGVVGVTNASGDLPGNTKYFWQGVGYGDWNSEATYDWIYLFFGGLALEAGTYYFVFQGGRIPAPGITIHAEAGADVSNTAYYSGGAWHSLSHLCKFEVHGWDEDEGTSIISDINPMNLAYQTLTEYLHFTDDDIDLVNFEAAATTLTSENQGMGLVLTSTTPAVDVLSMIEDQVDGRFYLDRVTGKWCIQLIRDDYDPETIPVLDDDNIVRIETFSRGTWQSTMNTLQLEFNNRDGDYADASIMAIDHANVQIQGGRVPAPATRMPAVCTKELATVLAWRELKSFSVPLCLAKVRVTRDQWNLHEGRPIRFAPASLNTNIVMRVVGMMPSDEDNGPIELDLAQDIFTGGEITLASQSSSWQEESTSLIPFDHLAVSEMPEAVLRRQSDTTGSRLLAAAAATGKGEEGYDIFADATLVGDGSVTPRALVDGDLSAVATVVPIVTDQPLSRFPVTTDSDIGNNLSGLILVDDELMAVRSAAETDVGLSLTVYRGLCDTSPAAHSSGADVWLLFMGWAGSTSALTRNSTVDVKLIPKTVVAQVDEADVTPVEITLQDRDLRPYPPTNPRLNGDLTPAEVDIDSGVTVTFLRRDHRIYDEVSQLAVDAETLDPTFPAAEGTQYRLRLKEDGDVVWTGEYNGGLASLGVSLVKIIRACDGCPTVLTFAVTARHNTTYEALQDLEHEATVDSVLLDDTYLGTLDTGQTSDPWTAPVDGDYTFTLSAALDEDLQAKVNGGALQTVIAAGNLAGDLTGIVESDIIEIRHTDSTSSDEVLLTIDAPGTATDAYAVLIFENEYWKTGGFGRGGFGLDKFGR
ncbi:phage tail protein [Candidatus Pacearchaeota archaeon]|nr:phage tail protein [Candidatus Pacearchaeota archaeon]